MVVLMTCKQCGLEKGRNRAFAASFSEIDNSISNLVHNSGRLEREATNSKAKRLAGMMKRSAIKLDRLAQQAFDAEKPYG